MRIQLICVLGLITALGCESAAEEAPPPVTWELREDLSAHNDYVVALASAGDDLVVAGVDGTTQEPDPRDLSWRVERIRPDRARAWTRSENPSPGDDRVASLALRGDALYVASHEPTGVADDLEWRVERRAAADDALVWSRRFSSADDREQPTDLAVDATGVYAVGIAQPMRFDLWRVEKRGLEDGEVVWSWEAEHEEFDNRPRAVDVGDGVVFVGGTDHDRDSQDGSWRLQAHDGATGALQWEVTSNPSPRWEPLNDLAAHDGSLVAIGTEHRMTESVWRIERRDPADGSLLWAVTGVAGVARAVVMDERGLFVVGHERVDPRTLVSLWRVERRSLADGALLWADTLEPELGSAEATAAALDARGLIVGGWDTGLGERAWRVERRDL
ncbi:MAG: hypothetical protein RLO52_16510 [Sandaracinaceae bacterium]